MKPHCTIIIGLMLGAILAGCQKDQELIKEPKVTETKTDVFANQAVFEWTVDYPGKICSMIEISQNKDMSDAIRYGSDTETINKDFNATATGLNEDTQYYYRYVVWNPSIHFEMETHHFTTKENCKPTVVTSAVKHITFTSATCVGEVTDHGGTEVTERGICWGTSPNPDISGSHHSSGVGVGSYTVELSGLAEEVTYYIRAYAINGQGTSYGSEKSFISKDAGALKGKYSVSALEKVYFSQGNLQYQASTNTWRFAEFQYDCVGEDNNNISLSYSGWIDLFCWGTSGWNSGANCYQPWSISNNCEDYYIGGSYNNDMTGYYANADWGVNNAISNGGNEAGLWRTLTTDEWTYVFNTRETTSSMRYAKVCVNDVNGVILLPDDWNSNYYVLNDVNNPNGRFDHNVISLAQWDTIEQYGTVFLPAAGYRYGNSTDSGDTFGEYWSASSKGEKYAYMLDFDYWDLHPNFGSMRNTGQSVRLVREVQ